MSSVRTHNGSVLDNIEPETVFVPFRTPDKKRDSRLKICIIVKMLWSFLFKFAVLKKLKMIVNNSEDKNFL